MYQLINHLLHVYYIIIQGTGGVCVFFSRIPHMKRGVWCVHFSTYMYQLINHFYYICMLYRVPVVCGCNCVCVFLFFFPPVPHMKGGVACDEGPARGARA